MTDKKITVPLILSLIGFIFVLAGVMLFLLAEDTFGKTLSASFIIVGAIVVIPSARRVKRDLSMEETITYDERAEINRLKAADKGFRFYFISLSVLIFLHATELVNEVLFIALTGPIIAVGMVLYLYFYYRYEKMGGAEL